MSVKGQVKELAGYIEEESNEGEAKKGDTEAQMKAQKGRDLRNEGRIEDGKKPMLHKPGTGHPPTKEDDNEA